MLRLGARVFALEVDVALFRALRAAHDPLRLPLLDDAVVSMGEAGAVDDLAVEYCRLFIGPRPPCPPYASVHTGAGILGHVHAHAVTELSARHGIRIDVAAGAPVRARDHVAVMLTLLAGLEACDAEAASAFTRRFLRPWLPGYLEKVEREAHLNPYRTVSRALRTLMTAPDSP